MIKKKNRLTFWTLIALFWLTAGLVIGAATRKSITIPTPRKKSVGLDTVVIFDHEAHQKRTDCMTCHATIIRELEHPANTMQSVHEVCRTCHKKGLSAEKQTDCTSCHVQPKTK